ncbi:MAG TPA: ATP-dependent Clp protease proteolytic subunit [Candidatus Sulfotelmatobacter sp.]|nr:ATP-dependent Clp protease proteolytic subunit [Candidatus Sulfotelmatobacter sp.]
MQSDLNCPASAAEKSERSVDFNARPPGPCWFTVIRQDDGTARVSIAGEIGLVGQPVEDCIAQIGDARRVELTINSVGGDGIAAFKLFDALHGRDVTAEIFTACYSAAVIIALAARKIRIEAGAQMMIHTARSFAFGDGEELRLYADKNDNANYKLRDLILRRVKELALVKTWLAGGDYYFTASEAVKLGLADEVFTLPVLPAASPALVPDAVPPAQTEDEILFWDFLRAFGRVDVADKEKFYKRLSLWATSNVRS